MRTTVSAASSAVVLSGLVAAFPVLATDWNGSYAAGGSCYCTGTLPSGVSDVIVPTPIGGQTVAAVCEQIGEGPGLNKSEGRFDKVVYPDAQCGHGPFSADITAADADCAGTREPGTSDCQVAGPRWDLNAAYAEAEVAPREVPTTARPAVAAATESVQPPKGDVVTINGQAWRLAPKGTAAIGGNAGSRIILDGNVYLKADDPVFVAIDTKPKPPTPKLTRRPLERQKSAKTVVQAPAPVIPQAPESRESLIERQKTLVAEARERARQRKEAAGLAESALNAEVDPIESEPSDTVAETDLGADPTSAPILGAATSDSELLDDDGSDAEAVEAVVESSDSQQSEERNGVLSALRLPADARGSSHDFSYVQAMPLSFDIGGAGVAFEGSAEFQDKFHLIARGAAANAYSEVLLGAGYHYTPASANRMTFMLSAGVEYGVFPLTDGQIEVDAEDTGLWLGAGSRLVVNPKFELEAGLGYSSFHEGDPTVFGGAFYHINRQVDVLSRFEIGDNDNLGIGLRVYY